MAVEKAYKCDLCGEFCKRSEFRRIAVRTADDRPDGATWVDIGPECHGRPVSEVITQAAIIAGEAPDEQQP